MFLSPFGSWTLVLAAANIFSSIFSDDGFTGIDSEHFREIVSEEMLRVSNFMSVSSFLSFSSRAILSL